MSSFTQNNIQPSVPPEKPPLWRKYPHLTMLGRIIFEALSIVASCMTILLFITKQNQKGVPINITTLFIGIYSLLLILLVISIYHLWRKIRYQDTIITVLKSVLPPSLRSLFDAKVKWLKKVSKGNYLLYQHLLAERFHQMLQDYFQSRKKRDKK